jgi:hypothetical protein
MAGEPVAILLSSYNGERFLREQLDSLLQQTHANTRVLVRDDGSTDGTRAILDSYARRHGNIAVTYGDNWRHVKSFFWLLDHAPIDAAYFCFCDQDDVWEADKVARGIRALDGIATPAMVFTNVQVVDAALRPLMMDSNRAPRGTAFENSLVQNIATGCTLMLNAAAAAVLRGKQVRHGELIQHDWWVYQVISAIGKAVYDPCPTVRYRQHDKNVVGQRGGWRAWAGRIRRQLDPSRQRLQRQAAELLRVHGGELPPAKLRVLEEFVRRSASPSWIERSCYALRAPLYRQQALDDFIMRLLIAAGRV